MMIGDVGDCREMVVGKTYRVEMSDCCVEGTFTSRLVRLDLDKDDPYYVDEAEFENGVVFTGTMGVTGEEVEP